MKNKFTPKARKIWEAIPLPMQEKILNNVWCSTCRKMTTMVHFAGKEEGGDLILTGQCARCNGNVARVVETG